MRHIFNSLLLEHKHSKQNDDIQYVSARKPSSAVHTQFTTANSKDEVECLVWNVSKSIVHRNAVLVLYCVNCSMGVSLFSHSSPAFL